MSASIKRRLDSIETALDRTRDTDAALAAARAGIVYRRLLAALPEHVGKRVGAVVDAA